MSERAAVVGLIVACALGLVRPSAAQRVVIPVRQMTIDGTKEDLSPVRGIAVSSAGTIAVMQPSDHQVLFFNSAGKRLGAFGRAGEGPGEFASMHAVLGWKADTLWVSELMRRRTTVITPGYKLARTLAGPDALYAPAGDNRDRTGYGNLAVRGLFANGDVLAMVYAEYRVASPTWLPTAARERGNIVARVTPAGSLKRFLAVIPSASDNCMVRFGTSAVSIRWCRMPLFSISAEDARITLLIPAPAEESSYWLTSVSGVAGDTLFHRSYSFRPVPIPHVVSEAMRTETMADRSIPPAMREAYRSMKYPAAYPPVSRLINGDDGTTWLEEYGDGDKPHRWRVLDRRGEFLGVLELPGNAWLAVASLTSLWAIESDADGVHSVSRYRVPSFQSAR